MKPAAWDWSKTRQPGDLALLLALTLVGLPFFLTFLYYWQHAFASPAPAPVAQVERWIEPLIDADYSTAGFAELARRQPDFSQARWTPVGLPDAVPIPPISETNGVPLSRVWMRYRYTAPEDEPPPVQVAVHVTRVMGGAWSVWVDGKLIDTNLEDWRMQWNVPLYVKLPVGSVTPGRPADIAVSFPVRASQGYAFGSMYVGDSACIDRIYQTRDFWQNTLPKAAIAITLLLGLLSLHHWFADRSERAHLMLAICAFVWFIANTQYFGDFLDDTASIWFSALNDAATSALLCVFTLFAIQFDGERWPRVEIGLIAYAVVVAIVTLPMWDWGVYALTFQHYVDLLLIFLVFGYYTWRSFTTGSHEYRAIMLAVWTMPIMGLHNIYYLTAQRAPDGIHLFPYSTFVLFGTFLYVMQRRYHQARISLVELNASLDERLRAREAELDAQHRTLMATEQQRVVYEERQRIMRDMHDGIGTTLMTSLVLAEHGQLPVERTAVVLRETLDELKLVIDSLEPVDNDIGALLANLRFRFGQRIEDAGVHIAWEMAELPPLPWLDPTNALQVLHIVQEAVVNVLKHSRATEICISARPAARTRNRNCVVVRITDNGIGFDPEVVKGGRGLNNLRRRAADLGAELNIHSRPGLGASVALHLPLDEVACLQD
jgi:signal transduction histidine kinase